MAANCTMREACLGGDAAAVQHLLEVAAWAPCDGGQLPLYIAAQCGRAAVVQLLLVIAPTAATTADSDGWLPLHAAAQNGHEAVASLLLQAAPAAAGAADTEGWLPLQFAAQNGHEAVVRLLLQAAPAAAGAADAHGWLPLHFAARNGHEAVVRLLLQAAPTAATAMTIYDETPLQLALRNGPPSVALALLGAGPASPALAALAASPFPALFVEFLLAPGRLPLSAADWALVPSPCIGAGRALPAALACAVSQAAQLERRLPASDAARLRATSVCLDRCGLPGAVTARILAQAA